MPEETGPSGSMTFENAKVLADFSTCIRSMVSLSSLTKEQLMQLAWLSSWVSQKLAEMDSELAMRRLSLEDCSRVPQICTVNWDSNYQNPVVPTILPPSMPSVLFPSATLGSTPSQSQFSHWDLTHAHESMNSAADSVASPCSVQAALQVINAVADLARALENVVSQIEASTRVTTEGTHQPKNSARNSHPQSKTPQKMFRKGRR